MVIFFDLDFASFSCNYFVTLFSGTGRLGGGGGVVGESVLFKSTQEQEHPHSKQCTSLGQEKIIRKANFFGFHFSFS
jgi:hypothetical protein